MAGRYRDICDLQFQACWTELWISCAELQPFCFPGFPPLRNYQEWRPDLSKFSVQYLATKGASSSFGCPSQTGARGSTGDNVIVVICVQ